MLKKHTLNGKLTLHSRVICHGACHGCRRLLLGLIIMNPQFRFCFCVNCGYKVAPMPAATPLRANFPSQ